MKKFYLVAMIIGGVIPLYLFSMHFNLHGFGLSTFISAAFSNHAASGLIADLLISVIIGLIVFGREARELGIRKFWMVVLGTCLIGFSFGLPLYLYLREGVRVPEKRGIGIESTA